MLRIGIRCLFDHWIRDLGWVKNQGWTTRIIFPRAVRNNFLDLNYLPSLMRRYSGSWMEKIWIWDPGRKKIRIRDKHPGSATPVFHYRVMDRCILRYQPYRIDLQATSLWLLPPWNKTNYNGTLILFPDDKYLTCTFFTWALRITADILVKQNGSSFLLQLWRPSWRYYWKYWFCPFLKVDGNEKRGGSGRRL